MNDVLVAISHRTDVNLPGHGNDALFFFLHFEPRANLTIPSYIYMETFSNF